MKRLGYAVFILTLALTALCLAQGQGLLLDDFEGVISGGPDGTLDFGAGGGSSVEVAAATDIKSSGTQSLKVVYNAVPGGYMWMARGIGLDSKNACWLAAPENLEWVKFNAFSFYVYGSGTKTEIAFDIKDSGNEMWRFTVTDNFTGWKQIVCPFNEFLARGDWQPDTADKNGNLDFPIKSFQFEPLPESKGTLYFDDVELIKK